MRAVSQLLKAFFVLWCFHSLRLVSHKSFSYFRIFQFFGWYKYFNFADARGVSQLLKTFLWFDVLMIRGWIGTFSADYFKIFQFFRWYKYFNFADVREVSRLLKAFLCFDILIIRGWKIIRRSVTQLSTELLTDSTPDYRSRFNHGCTVQLQGFFTENQKKIWLQWWIQSDEVIQKPSGWAAHRELMRIAKVKI